MPLLLLSFVVAVADFVVVFVCLFVCFSVCNPHGAAMLYLSRPLTLDVYYNFATPAALVHDVTDTDCLPQNGKQARWMLRPSNVDL